MLEALQLTLTTKILQVHQMTLHLLKVGLELSCSKEEMGFFLSAFCLLLTNFFPYVLNKYDITMKQAKSFLYLAFNHPGQL